VSLALCLGVSGSRYGDVHPFRVLAELSNLWGWSHGSMQVEVGDAPGVDEVVRDVCRRSGLPCNVHVAHWTGIGTGDPAGPERNGRIVKAVLDSPATRKLFLGFPGPRSSGTYNALKQALNAGLEAYMLEGCDVIPWRPGVKCAR
jgi:hypothetical protein